MNKLFFLKQRINKSIGLFTNEPQIRYSCFDFNRRLYWLLAIPLLASCNSLLNKEPLQTNYYTLETAALQSIQKSKDSAQNELPALTISTPKVAAGLNTRRMLYTRSAHQIEYFARHEWVDTPANMLQSLLVSSLDHTGLFKAVTPKISTHTSDLRVESQLITLIQDFSTQPSQVKFSLRIIFIENKNNRVIANRLFNQQVQAESETPVAGVVAANLAVNQVLQEIDIFSQQLLKSTEMQAFQK